MIVITEIIGIIEMLGIIEILVIIVIIIILSNSNNKSLGFRLWVDRK